MNSALASAQCALLSAYCPLALKVCADTHGAAGEGSGATLAAYCHLLSARHLSLLRRTAGPEGGSSAALAVGRGLRFLPLNSAFCLSHNTLSFQQHSRLERRTLLFSNTFPLRSEFFHSDPLFSTTFPLRSFIFLGVAALPQPQCPWSECRFPGFRGGFPSPCHRPGGKQWPCGYRWGVRFAGSAISLAFGRAGDRMRFPGAGSRPTLPQQGQVRGPILKCVRISHR